ncbi:hypothetical protein ACS0TY_022663 [Phlomoides rotata]
MKHYAVLSSRYNKWGEVKEMKDISCRSGAYCQRGVSLNGSFYWLSVESVEEVYDLEIICFDGEVEKFKKLPMPNYCKKIFYGCSLTSSGSHLYLFVGYFYDVMNIWKRVSGDETDSWMEFKVQLKSGLVFVRTICWVNEGLAGTHYSWGPQVKGLAETVTQNEEESPADDRISGGEVCAFDNRGVGQSSVPTKMTSIMAKDAIALMDHWVLNTMEGLTEVESEAIDVDDIDEGERESCFVGRLVTEEHWNPSNLIEAITIAWKPKHGMSSRVWEDSKLILFCFDDVMDRNWVLKNQPWCFKGSLFAIQKITRGGEQQMSSSNNVTLHSGLGYMMYPSRA